MIGLDRNKILQWMQTKWHNTIGFGLTFQNLAITVVLLFKAWSHRGTDMYRRENGLKYAEFGYPVTKFISSAAQSSRDRHVEPGS